MRLLVCGGRDYADRDAVFRAMDLLVERRGRPDVVIHGACHDPETGGMRGADALAREWAIMRGVPEQGFPADWYGDGLKAAGPIRNARMLREDRPQGVVAFPTHPVRGRGTLDMAEKAEDVGLKVWWPYGRFHTG